MRAKILYMTKTGHSRKIAKELASRLGIEAFDAKQSPDLQDTDLVIVIGGIYGGVSNPDLVKFIRSTDTPTFRKAALITSCASRKFFQKEVRAALVERGIDVFAEELVVWGSFLFYGWGHPNASDFDAGATFVEKVMKLS